MRIMLNFEIYYFFHIHHVSILWLSERKPTVCKICRIFKTINTPSVVDVLIEIYTHENVQVKNIYKIIFNIKGFPNG